MGKILLGLLKALFIVTFVVAITFAVWIYFRGSQPIDVPEARGITFWQFIKERWEAYRTVDAKISVLPQYLGCHNDIIRLLPSTLRGAFNFSYASLYPESKLAEAFRYWEVTAPDPILPKLKQKNIVEIPDVFWSYFERAYWRGLVTLDNLAGECQLGPVDFDAILIGGA